MSNSVEQHQADLRQMAEELKNEIRVEIRQVVEESKHEIGIEIRQMVEELKHEIGIEILQMAEDSKQETGNEVQWAVLPTGLQDSSEAIVNAPTDDKSQA